MLFKRKKKENTKEICDSTLIKLDRLKRNKFRFESVDKLNGVIRELLKELYKIPREITTIEMVKRINGKRLKKEIKEEIIFTISEIYEAEFESPMPIHKPQFNDLINQAKKLVKLISNSIK